MGTLTGKAHELLSRRALLPLARLQRRARPSRRAVMAAFDEGMRFRRESAAWSAERRREWVLARLRVSVRASSSFITRCRKFCRHWLGLPYPSTSGLYCG